MKTHSHFPQDQIGWKLIRVLALIFMLLCITMFTIGIFEFQEYAVSHASQFIPYSPPWTLQSFTKVLDQIGLSLNGWLLLRLVTSILHALVFFTVGLLIFFRKQKDWFGLYIAVVFVLFGTVSTDPATAFSGMNPQFTWILTPLGVLCWWAFFQLLFLFPNGHFTPSWTRWVASLLLVLYCVSVIGYGTSSPPAPIILGILGLFGVGAASQVYRYRKVSTPSERQQTKWVMAAMVVVFTDLMISILPLAIPEWLVAGSQNNLIVVILSFLPSVFIPLIPLSFAFAILRYRLWDIDLIIRRTMQYGLVTVLLGLVYYGMVLLLGQIFLTASGQGSPLVLVISTLAIAALFNPLRRRIQTSIDRRFFRGQYNAGHALDRFSQALRSQVDLPAIENELVGVVTETIQPEGITLWIREVKK